jgi:hypothetical protein
MTATSIVPIDPQEPIRVPNQSFARRPVDILALRGVRRQVWPNSWLRSLPRKQCAYPNNLKLLKVLAELSSLRN